jgi:hypothetical protein
MDGDCSQPFNTFEIRANLPAFFPGSLSQRKSARQPARVQAIEIQQAVPNL